MQLVVHLPQHFLVCLVQVFLSEYLSVRTQSLAPRRNIHGSCLWPQGTSHQSSCHQDLSTGLKTHYCVQPLRKVSALLWRPVPFPLGPIACILAHPQSLLNWAFGLLLCSLLKYLQMTRKKKKASLVFRVV